MSTLKRLDERKVKMEMEDSYIINSDFIDPTEQPPEETQAPEETQTPSDVIFHPDFSTLSLFPTFVLIPISWQSQELVSRNISDPVARNYTSKVKLILMANEFQKSGRNKIQLNKDKTYPKGIFNKPVTDYSNLF